MALDGLSPDEIDELVAHLESLELNGDVKDENDRIIKRLKDLVEAPKLPSASHFSANNAVGRNLRENHFPRLLSQNYLCYENANADFAAHVQVMEDSNALRLVRNCHRQSIKEMESVLFYKMKERTHVTPVVSTLLAHLFPAEVKAHAYDGGATECDLTVKLNPHTLLMVELKNASKPNYDIFANGHVFAQLLVDLISIRKKYPNWTFYGCATNGTFWRFLKVSAQGESLDITTIPLSPTCGAASVNTDADMVVAYLKTIAAFG